MSSSAPTEFALPIGTPLHVHFPPLGHAAAADPLSARLQPEERRVVRRGEGEFQFAKTVDDGAAGSQRERKRDRNTASLGIPRRASRDTWIGSSVLDVVIVGAAGDEEGRDRTGEIAGLEAGENQHPLAGPGAVRTQTCARRRGIDGEGAIRWYPDGRRGRCSGWRRRERRRCRRSRPRQSFRCRTRPRSTG